MRKSILIISLITFYVVFSIVYFLFLSETGLYFVFILIGSVAVLSTGAIYMLLESSGNREGCVEERRSILPQKATKQIRKALDVENSDIIDDYFDAMPYLKEYLESDKSYKDVPVVKELIFSTFSIKDLRKINLLGLSNQEKIEFLRELLYYDAHERDVLIESLLKNRSKTGDDIIYSPPFKMIDIGESIRAYMISLVEPGEKRKLLVLDTSEMISSVKEKTAELFDYGLNDFLLSCGGLILEEDRKVENYDIIDEDEIVLIPPRIEKD